MRALALKKNPKELPVRIELLVCDIEDDDTKNKLDNIVGLG